ncbi:MAG: two pore domain potassium channel family protein [Acetobacteraceae bacterium]|nr:two pore domain potassium channel family protein [Acetobacteraceae bacterium]
MRRRFLLALGHNLRVVWPILSGILAWQLAFGVSIAWVGDGFYFTFVTGLTIGYGDLVPRHFLSRLLVLLRQ